MLLDVVFEPSSQVDQIFGPLGVALDSYSRTLFCPNSPSRKMLVWVHQASSLNGESRLCVCGILASFNDSLCTYGNSAAKNCYSIHYIYSLHWVLTIFVINVFCCIYWEFVVAGGFVELLLHCIVLNLFPVVVGLMNPCSWFPNNYGLLLFSLEEWFGVLIKGWIRIRNVVLYLMSS